MRILTVAAIIFLPLSATISAQENNNITLIKAATLEQTARKAENEKVIDITVRHVKDGDSQVGIGVLHRPIMKSDGPITAIMHHNQSEVYRIMAGSGTLATSSTMENIKPLDPTGFTVLNLTGPSDFGKIMNVENSQIVSTGDIVIIPAGIAHGFSEITEAIDYTVVRIDPDNHVALK
jgi:mannose-6-phosphate isomerase-like protein (cupin superfamily)